MLQVLLSLYIANYCDRLVIRNLLFVSYTKAFAFSSRKLYLSAWGKILRVGKHIVYSETDPQSVMFWPNVRFLVLFVH